MSYIGKIIRYIIPSSEKVFEYTGEGCVVPKDVTIVRFHRSVTEVEDDAFEYCKQLREVMFNDGLQKIGKFAFYDCTSLSSIKLPSTVTEIGEWAFRNCEQLREVVFNDGLQKIGDYAFYDCASLNLRKVVLNEGLRKIGVGAFGNCTSLSSIAISSTVTEIEDWAFRYCKNLRAVVLHGISREIGKDAFRNCISLERFTFPTISSRLDNLIHTGHWEDIENEVDEVRGVVEMSGSALFVSAQAMGGSRNWNAVRRDLDKIIRLLSYYELKEGTSMLELALWKFKLDQVDKANPIPRKKCRMDVPGPVKDIILQYLPYE